MLTLILYLFFLMLELGLAVFFIIYFATLIYSSLKGAPYVPTKYKELEKFLKEVEMKKGQTFLELGSGDGRVVRTAVKLFGVKGIGIDVSPVLTLVARWKAKRQNLKNIEFKTGNILKVTHPKSEYIYLFLFPELIEKLKSKLLPQLKSGTVIISHGFKIKEWDKYIYKTLESRPFHTYYYSNKKSR